MSQPAQDAGTPPEAHSQTIRYRKLADATAEALLRELRILLRGRKPTPGLLFLALADLTLHTPDHRVTIAERELCKIAGISKGAFPEAIKALQDTAHVRVDASTKHFRNRYTVNWWETICGSIPDPLAPAGGSISNPQLGLNLTHTGSNIDPPATPTIRARAPSNLETEPLDRNLDRVFQSEIQDHDKDAFAYIRRRLHSYMAKYGRHDAGPNQGSLYTDTPGHPPHEPDKAIVARLMGIAPPDIITNLLDTLCEEASKAYALRPNFDNAYQCRRYAWFITTALDRIHGIHWSTTAKATAQWHLHQNTKPAEQTGREFARDLTRQAAAGAKTLR